MGITIYPARFNPRTKTFANGVSVLIEVDVIENFDQSWENPGVEQYPFVSLNSQSVADLSPLLGWDELEFLEGVVYTPLEICQKVWQAKNAIGSRNDEFQGMGHSMLAEIVGQLSEGGCSVISGSTSPLQEKLDRILALAEWVEDFAGVDARLQIG